PSSSPPSRVPPFFCFTATSPPHIYTLSLHDALPIALEALVSAAFILIGGKVGDLIGRKRAFTLGLLGYATGALAMTLAGGLTAVDRKSTRLNSSHSQNSYAVFCLKKKNYLVMLVRGR